MWKLLLTEVSEMLGEGFGLESLLQTWAERSDMLRFKQSLLKPPAYERHSSQLRQTDLPKNVKHTVTLNP